MPLRVLFILCSLLKANEHKAQSGRLSVSSQWGRGVGQYQTAGVCRPLCESAWQIQLSRNVPEASVSRWVMVLLTKHSPSSCMCSMCSILYVFYVHLVQIRRPLYLKKSGSSTFLEYSLFVSVSTPSVPYQSHSWLDISFRSKRVHN